MRKLLATTSLALLIAGPALAQSQMMAPGFVESYAAGDVYGSDLIGMRLYMADTRPEDGAVATADMRANWEDVGEINDVIVGMDGQIKAVLLDVGGFLGMGEKTVAVSMDSLTFVQDGDDENDHIVFMQGSKEVLEQAPEYQRDMQAAMNSDNNSSTGTTTTGTTATGTTATGTTAMTADRQDGTAWTRPTQMREGYVDLEPTELTAENLTGATVYGANDDSIGEVQDIVITADGQTEGALIDVGGFLGIGEHRIEVSFDELQVVRQADGDEVRVYIDATKEQLKARPAYKS